VVPARIDGTPHFPVFPSGTKHRPEIARPGPTYLDVQFTTG
jgi:hypothetical protein